MSDSTAPTRTYTVHGMTRDHCAASVSEQVRDLEGIDRVAVDITSGRLEVTGNAVGDAEVSAAVEEAGYRLADNR